MNTGLGLVLERRYISLIPSYSNVNLCVCVCWSVRHVGKIQNLLVTVWKTHNVNLINCFTADMWSSVFFMIILYVCTLRFADSTLWFQEAVAFGHKKHSEREFKKFRLMDTCIC